MRTVSSILLCVCTFYSFILNAQHSCSSSELHHKKYQGDQAYRQRHDRMEEQMLSRKKTHSPTNNVRATPATYTLPVVFHIIHNGGAENIGDAQVLAALNHLNDAYEHVSPFDGVGGVDTKIEFCMARQDPSGAATSGINRVLSPLTNVDAGIDDVDLKNLIRWDPTRYINIWLVKEICNGTDCGTAGYAYMASAHGSTIDGIVCEATLTGSSVNNSKVLVHEMGHYLNLYHTFEGACTNGSCLSDGDRVCDTPPDNKNTAAPGCATENTCSTDALSGFTSDENDYINNYMDYSGQACQAAFTAGQRDRMHAAITGPRVSLLSSTACNSPCPFPSTISFIASATSGFTGDNITFTNTSVGTDLTYKWIINGTEMSTSPTAYSHIFGAAGTYDVTLIAHSTNSLCLDKEYSLEVSISCPVNASFSSSAISVSMGSTVTFTNTSTGADFYNWFIQGVSQGSSLASHTFTSASTYEVMLVAYNGVCTDTAVTWIVVSNVGGGCTNMDFESGNLDGWIGYTASATEAGVPGPLVPGIDPNRHKIVNSGYDEIVGGTILPKVAPGGSFSLRLENTDPGAMAAIVEQTFLVTPANAHFVYRYAVVLQDPGDGHPDGARPYFSVLMRDGSGNPITCADYKVIAKPPLTGFTNILGTSYWYRNWTSVSVPLTAYIGQNITVRYTSSDCAWGGHKGYAYLDGTCQGFEITSASSIICSPDVITLNGPKGFSTYSWTGPGIVGSSTGSDVRVNAAGTYTLTVAPIDQPTCGFSKTYTVSTGTATPNAGPDIMVCKYQEGVKLNGSGGSVYHWSPTTGLSDPDIPDPTVNPTVTTTYTLTTCGATDQVTVTVYDGFDLTTTDDTTVCGLIVRKNLNVVPDKPGVFTYSWFPTDSLSNPYISNPSTELLETMTYVVTVSEASGCVRKDSVKITVNPTLPLSISASPLALCKNNAVTTVDLHAATSPAASVVWNIGASVLGSGPDLVVAPTKTTTYSVRTTESGCTSESEITVPYYSVDAGLDTTVCGGPFRLHAEYFTVDKSECNYMISGIPYVNRNHESGDSFVLFSSGDAHSAALPIGFDFNFFCNSYSQFYIGINGYIMFDSINGKSPYPQRLPDMDTPNNLIALAWSDLEQPSMAKFQPITFYRVTGTAPFRVLTVLYTTLTHKSNTTVGYPIKMYVKLFETTNVIEIYTSNQPFNSGVFFTQGLENADGTVAAAEFPRNKSMWSTMGTAVRYTPTMNVVYSWSPEPMADGKTLTPLVNPLTSTTYTVTADNGICTTTDQVFVEVNCTPMGLGELGLSVEKDRESNYVVFPQPVGEDGRLQIKGIEIEQVQLYDMHGKLHWTGIPEKSETGYSVDLKILTSGIYVLKMIGPKEARSVMIEK